MSDRPLVLALLLHEANRELVADCLSEHGFDVRTAEDLAGGHRSLAEEKPDGAVIDLSGLSDEVWKFCQELRQRSVPFLVLSPSDARDIRKASRASGAEGVRVKPVARQELVALVERLVDAPVDRRAP